MLLRDSDEYNRTVQEWVKLYATPPLRYDVFTCCGRHFAQPYFKAAQLRAIYLVLSAAAACPIFGPRSVHAHYLQPPAELGPTLSQRSLEHVQELLCRDNKQRVQLVCCSSPLSTLARHLVGASNSSQVVIHWHAIASIMKRCFSGFALQDFPWPPRSW
jgi:hypothetical protein